MNDEPFKPICDVIKELSGKFQEISKLETLQHAKAESEPEMVFWDWVRKLSLDKRKLFLAQLKIEKYRVDCIFKSTRGYVIIEIDGKEFHEYERDAARDAFLMSSPDIYGILRIDASAILYFPDATKRLLGKWLSDCGVSISFVCDPSITALEGIEMIKQAESEFGEIPSELQKYLEDVDVYSEMEGDLIKYANFGSFATMRVSGSNVKMKFETRK